MKIRFDGKVSTSLYVDGLGTNCDDRFKMKLPSYDWYQEG